MRKAVAITLTCIALMGARLACATSSGLPVHTRIHWIHVLSEEGLPYIILKPGQKPPPLMTERGSRIPGTWRTRGDTYLGDPVWQWHPGYPNGDSGQ